MDTNRSSEKCDELVGFVTARVVAATESEVGLHCFFLAFELIMKLSISYNFNLVVLARSESNLASKVP